MEIQWQYSIFSVTYLVTHSFWFRLLSKMLECYTLASVFWFHFWLTTTLYGLWTNQRDDSQANTSKLTVCSNWHGTASEILWLHSKRSSNYHLLLSGLFHSIFILGQRVKKFYAKLWEVLLVESLIIWLELHSISWLCQSFSNQN